LEPQNTQNFPLNTIAVVPSGTPKHPELPSKQFSCRAAINNQNFPLNMIAVELL